VRGAERDIKMGWLGTHENADRRTIVLSDGRDMRIAHAEMGVTMADMNALVEN
jgi:hypothetical protein